MQENLIQPIETIGWNRCPICGSIMVIADAEMSYLTIDAEGYPIGEETVYYRCQACCEKCKKAYDFKRSGIHYRPDSKVLDMMDRYESEKRLDLINHIKNKAGD